MVSTLPWHGSNDDLAMLRPHQHDKALIKPSRPSVVCLELQTSWTTIGPADCNSRFYFEAPEAGPSSPSGSEVQPPECIDSTPPAGDPPGWQEHSPAVLRGSLLGRPVVISPTMIQSDHRRFRNVRISAPTSNITLPNPNKAIPREGK